MNRKFEEALEYIKANCKADDFFFNIMATDKIETRFAQNMITQNMGGKLVEVSLKVAFGKKTGSANVNDLSKESLKDLIETSEMIAKMNVDDPEFVSSGKAVELPYAVNYSESTINCNEEEIVNCVKKCVDNAINREAKVSGLTARYINEMFLATKNGFVGHDIFSEFSHSMTMKKGKVEAKVIKSVKDYNDFSIDFEIDRLNSRFDSLSDPEQSEIGKYNVILRPEAVFNFFTFLNYFMDRRMADLGITPYTGQIGNKFFGEKFSLYSSISEKSLSFDRFTWSGIINKDIDFIRNGVLENMHVGRDYAELKGLEPTSMGNFIIDGEDTTEEEMMKIAGKGIIINNFWYIRNVDTKKGEITGLTRDGVNYFEDGEIKHSLTNLRFNEIPIEVTKRILALGKSLPITGSAKVPTLLIKDFNFADVTTF